MALKTEERQRNIEIYNEYLKLGVMQLVGDKYGITRERVRQIVSRFGYKKPKKIRLSPEEKAKIRHENKINRFWNQKVITASGCWEFTGSRFPTGYGHTGYKGEHDYSHRVAWILTNGDIPDGLCVCHKCDNPPCINPDHLFLGTVADNMRDRDAKGRGRGGKNSPKNCTTEKPVD